MLNLHVRVNFVLYIFLVGPIVREIITYHEGFVVDGGELYKWLVLVQLQRSLFKPIATTKVAVMINIVTIPIDKSNLRSS